MNIHEAQKRLQRKLKLLTKVSLLVLIVLTAFAITVLSVAFAYDGEFEQSQKNQKPQSVDVYTYEARPVKYEKVYDPEVYYYEIDDAAAAPVFEPEIGIESTTDTEVVPETEAEPEDPAPGIENAPILEPEPEITVYDQIETESDNEVVEPEVEVEIEVEVGIKNDLKAGVDIGEPIVIEPEIIETGDEIEIDIESFPILHTDADIYGMATIAARFASPAQQNAILWLIVNKTKAANTPRLTRAINDMLTDSDKEPSTDLIQAAEEVARMYAKELCGYAVERPFSSDYVDFTYENETLTLYTEGGDTLTIN